MVMCAPNSEMYLIVWCIGCVLYLNYHTKMACAMCNMVPDLWGRGRGILLLFLSREKPFASCVIPVHHTHWMWLETRVTSATYIGYMASEATVMYIYIKAVGTFCLASESEATSTIPSLLLCVTTQSLHCHNFGRLHYRHWQCTLGFGSTKLPLRK